MMIGVDAGCLGVGDNRLKVGVYRVVFHLLEELGKRDRENTYRLYSFYPIEKDVMASFGPRMINKVLWPMTGWFTLRLPLELMLAPVDLFLGVSQAIPRGAHRAIGFVYDLGFLHVPEAYPGSKGRLEEQTKNLIKRAHHIIAISHSTKHDIMGTFGEKESQITVSYPGVDSRFTEKGRAYTGRHPYILFVGSLKPSKNIPGALAGFAGFLKKTHTLYDFLVIGSDYWLDPEITKAVKNLGLEKRVKFLGFVQDHDLPMYYRGAMALLNPSLWEGFCLPAAEAMACGCPVVGSTAGSLPEIVGKGGILVGPHDTMGIAKAIHALSDPVTRSRYHSLALLQAKKFRWDSFASSIEGAL